MDDENGNFKKDEVITEIKIEHLKKLAGNKLNLESTQFDLSSNIFFIKNLDFMKDSQLLALDKLAEINLSNNDLENIDVLSNYRQLFRINASFNKILSVTLALEKLIEMDLSNNKLQTIPPFVRLPRLKKVFLQNNLIINISSQLNCLKNVLTLFDISSNKISFPTGLEFQKFMNNIKMMNALTILNLDKNPFMDQYPRSKDFLIRELCPQIENLNDEVIPESKIKELKNEQNFPRISDLTSVGGGTKIKAKSDGDLPSLITLNKMLEESINQPIKTMDIVTELTANVNLIVVSTNSWDSIFSSKDPDIQSELEDQMDNFLQNCLVLIENQHQIQGPVLNMIANFSVIQQSNFGKKCLGTLLDLMQSGSEMQGVLHDVISGTIIPLINKEFINEIPYSIINGVIQILKESDDDDFFTPQSFQCMAKWIKEIIKASRSKNYESDVFAKHELCLELIREASVDKENAEQFISLKIVPDVTELYKSSIVQQFGNRQCNSIKIIENLCRQDKSVCIDIIKQKENKTSLYKDLVEQFDYWMSQYKSNKNDLRDLIAKDTDEIVILKNKKYSTCISTLGVLNLWDQSLKKNTMENNKIILEVIRMMNQFKMNPELLTSCCSFILDLLNNQNVVKDGDMILWIMTNLQNLISLIPFLGLKKYGTICELAEMYQANTFYGNQPIALHHLTNRILHELFIQIIKLFSYFSYMSVNDPAENYTDEQKAVINVCDQVSKSLNANFRENALFKCLVIPSDRVRSEAVKSLLLVKQDEWEPEEIGEIVKIMSTFKNLSAGNTEEVISSIFMILSNMCKDPSSKTAKNFISMQAEAAIDSVLDILSRNMERNLMNNQDENDQKVDLSLACIFFLQTLSKIPSVRPFLRGNQVQLAFKRSLTFEQLFIHESYLPVQIEKTWAGRNVEYLLQCFSGVDSLEAYHMVSFRVISRIADILEGSANENQSEIGKEGYDTQQLRQDITSNFMNSLEDEFDIWKIKTEDPMASMNESEKEHYIKQHQLFSNQNGKYSFLTRYSYA